MLTVPLGCGFLLAGEYPPMLFPRFLKVTATITATAIPVTISRSTTIVTPIMILRSADPLLCAPLCAIVELTSFPVITVSATAEAPSLSVTGDSEGVWVVGFTAVIDDVTVVVEISPSDAVIVMSTVVVSLEVVVFHITDVVCDIVVTEGGVYVGSRNATAA